jgi:hypothetical protein
VRVSKWAACLDVDTVNVREQLVVEIAAAFSANALVALL